MTTSERIQIVKSLVDNDSYATDAVITVYLADAKEAILNRAYPFGAPESVTDVPKRYERAQCKLAARYFLRRGAEGEKTHNENGINRTYGSVNDEDILQEVMQVVKVV